MLMKRRCILTIAAAIGFLTVERGACAQGSDGRDRARAVAVRIRDQGGIR